MQRICQRYLFSIIILHVHPQYTSHIYKILKEYIESLRLISLYVLWSLFIMRNGKKVQVGKDQEKAQSEKDSHSKNRGGKKPN